MEYFLIALQLALGWAVVSILVPIIICAIFYGVGYVVWRINK